MRARILGVALTMAVAMGQQSAEPLFQLLNGRPATVEGFGRRVVKGKPFSATEEQHFLQVLSDGTRIETRQTTRIYRDGEGRMRLENTTPEDKTRPGFEFGPITIVDPVVNTRTTIDPQRRQRLRESPYMGTTFVFRGASGEGKAQPPESLRTKNVNGVMARGERTVSVIPAGEIGNNREIRIVNERWYSDDLQLLIKSTNADPRFGDTTYELTGIVLGEPSASLFDVPDYPEMQVGRGGLGVAQPTGAGGRGKGKK